MNDKIVIDFDGEDPEEENKENEDRIVIEFDNEEGKEDEKVINIEPDQQHLSREEIILKSKINSGYRGNPQLTNFFKSGINFPEGIENGFRKKFVTDLKDEFFNSILESNKYIILASGKGRVYFIDRFKGRASRNIFIKDESFEKTGLVYENRVFLNSLKKIREISGDDFQQKEIYASQGNFYIWSNLNRYNESLVFIEYSPSERKARLKLAGINDAADVREFEFEVKKFVSDKICIAGGFAYVLFDSELLVYDFNKMTGSVYPVDKRNEIVTDENSFIFYLHSRLFISTRYNEIYYLDLPALNYDFKFSGIKSSYINSAGGFDDNLFTGTLDGWKFYKSSGLSVYSFDDEYENRIECISRNVIVLSKRNKIIFCNLNRFQEAEGYVISSSENKESAEIISAVISGNEIFVLTSNGILEVYTNDKLNIHI